MSEKTTYWQYLEGQQMIVTANADGTVPINSRVVAKLADASPDVIALIIEAPQMLGALRAVRNLTSPPVGRVEAMRIYQLASAAVARVVAAMAARS
jgi:hypothetical protein